MKFLTLAAVLVLMTTTTAMAQTKTDADAFSKAVVGNTLLGKTEKGQDYSVFYKPDNTMTFNLVNGWSDEGTWRVEGAKFCQKWKQIRGGADYCIRDIENDGTTWSYFNELISQRQSVEVKPGKVSIY